MCNIRRRNRVFEWKAAAAAAAIKAEILFESLFEILSCQM
jgi:hypothetical protein